MNSRIKQIQNGASGGDNSCKLVHLEEGNIKFEHQILNELLEYKFENENYQEWVKCSLKIILNTIEDLKIKNEFKERQELFLNTKKEQLQRILTYSKKDFKLFLSEIIVDFDKNQQYLINTDLHQLLNTWIDYEILFNNHTIVFIENIDFFIPDTSVMKKNLFIFSRHIFTIKSKIQKEIKDKVSQRKYLDILNNKIYINQELIKEYTERTGLRADEYYRIKEKVGIINANIELVQLSLLIYKKQNISEFSTSIKTIN